MVDNIVLNASQKFKWLTWDWNWRMLEVIFVQIKSNRVKSSHQFSSQIKLQVKTNATWKSDSNWVNDSYYPGKICTHSRFGQISCTSGRSSTLPLFLDIGYFFLLD